MGKNTEGMIKKAISETLIEEMFRDLGFFVLKLGQENTVNPITQLRDFISSCGGKFKLSYNDAPITFIRRLPDFVIVDTSGNVQFIEVKFSKNAYIPETSRETFLLFPTFIIVVNMFTDENFFRTFSKNDNFQDPMPDELKNSRFHVWTPEGETENDHKVTRNVSIEPLDIWLHNTFDISEKDLIDKYEALVEKWLSENTTTQ